MKVLKKVLGVSYGGPSISYENGKFILYKWYDAPVNMEILVSDKTWGGFVEKLNELK